MINKLLHRKQKINQYITELKDMLMDSEIIVMEMKSEKNDIVDLILIDKKTLQPIKVLIICI